MLRLLNVMSRGEGCLVRWASWDCDLPRRAWGKVVDFDQRVRRPCWCSDPPYSENANVLSAFRA
eukprot:4056187-Alexandrium_andersonii.AAC.1